MTSCSCMRRFLGTQFLLVLAALVVAAFALPSHGSAATLNTLYAFCQSSCADGAQPNSALLRDQDGNLYGVTPRGGASATGVVYEMSFDAVHGTWTYQTLFSFCDSNDKSCLAIEPVGSLIIDNDGNLYGVTGGNTKKTTGAVFELSPNQNRTHWAFKILYKFCRAICKSHGPTQPKSGLTYAGASTGVPFDGASPLYGTAATGGASSGGAIYKLSPAKSGKKWKAKTLYDFCAKLNCADGGDPAAAPLIDSAGNLYGTTEGGGAHGHGEVYELPHGGTTVSVLYSFCASANCADGYEPTASVIMDGTGNLIGTTGGGGNACFTSAGCGLIFKLAPIGGGWQETVLYAFCQQANCTDGAVPYGGVTMDASGNLFGTTENGGSEYADGHGSGIVYELSGTSLTVLHAFCGADPCSDEGHPEAGLTMDPSGSLYGTTNFSLVPDQSWGTVFQLTP